ncbi:ABC transporter substrate-binding protein [Ketogulonicigenium vulgare]|uniref:ABC transporter substrate-binding protein n=1 Tax=Ketogulonicigenium vulgare TaxID=92945 RepID=UPI00235A2096|nr:ABC transporter substrate-binding protein [Ketogulonicigenium vulgare]
MAKSCSTLALIAAAVSTATAAAANDAVNFQLDWTPGGISAAYYMGLEAGCFTDQGIDVTISRGYGAADAVTKVATRVADFSVTDLGVIVGTIANSGAPVKAILPIVQQSPVGIAVLENSPIQSLNDLEGRSIGTSVGNAAIEYLPLGMEAAGADLTKVEHITADGSALNGMLFRGQIDALASYVTSVVQLNTIGQATGQGVRAIYYGDALNIYNASVFTSDALIAENPDLVARFSAAVQCSYNTARENPEATIDAVTKHVEGMIRDTQVDAVPFALDFAFNNPVFAANGFNWDMDRVANNIAATGRVHDLANTALTPADVVYTPASQ